MQRRATVLAFLLCVLLGQTASAEIDGNRFTDPASQLELTVPPDWRLSEHSSYPGILLFAVNGRARMTLAAESVPDGIAIRSHCELSERTLKKAGFVIRLLAPHPSGAYILDATGPDKKTRVRQGYYIRGGIAYVLTLAAPAVEIRSHYRAFSDTLRSLLFQ
ncbi:MAG: hypothetical protein V2A73_13250 [Pseudomonadota bacterium]